MTSADYLALRDQLIQHEGIRLHVYQDSRGIETIGVGRNLRNKGISYAEAMMLLDHDITDFDRALEQALPWSEGLDAIRKRVLLDMAFNVGVEGLLTFKQFLASVKTGDYVVASQDMLESAWARQVGRRAVTLSQMMKTGAPGGDLKA